MSGDTTPIHRLKLLPMSIPFLEACIAGDTAAAEQLIGLQVPSDWYGETWLMQFRLDQARKDPTFAPWLPRAIALRDSDVMIGHVNFHTAPDPDYLRDLAPGGVEFGYTIFEPYRGQGYATEALAGLMEWTAQTHGVDRFVLSISPENAASLRIAHKLGFAKIGEHMDEEDGPEDIFECRYSAARG